MLNKEKDLHIAEQLYSQETEAMLIGGCFSKPGSERSVTVSATKV